MAVKWIGKWGPALLAILALALSVVNARRAPVPVQVHETPHTLAMSGGVDPYAFYANLRSQHQYWVTDPTFAGGAAGDDSHDDTAAINAANAAAAANNGPVVFAVPPVAYKVTSEIQVHYANPFWRCDGPANAKCIIRAHGSGLRSVVEWRNTFGEGMVATPGPIDEGPIRGWLEGITLDANSGAARQGLLLNGSEYSEFHRLHIVNAQGDCIRNASTQTAGTLSAVVQGGTSGSPSGVTVSTADSNYIDQATFPHGFGGGSVNIVIKIVNTGALGAATYQVSFNGGSTFSTPTWPVVAHIQIADFNGTETIGGTGILAAFPTGTYNSGTTYSFTWTANPLDFNEAQAVNDSMVFDSIQLGPCGTTYATSDFVSRITNNGFQVTASGTMATTANNQILVGTGTTWLQNGDCSWGRGAITDGASNWYPIAAVLDDTHIAVISGDQPTTTASGLSYAMSCNAAYYEDGALENQYGQFYDGTIGQSSIGMALAYTRCSLMTRMHMNSSAIVGAIAGAGNASMSGCVWNGNQSASGTVNSLPGVGYLFAATSDGELIEPMGTPTFAGTAFNWTVFVGGAQGPIATFGTNRTYTAQSVIGYLQSTQSISSAGQQITLPDQTPIGNVGRTSYIGLLPSGNFLMNATPVLSPTTIAGLVVILQNQAVNTHITFAANRVNSSGLILQEEFLSLAYGDSITLISQGPDPFGQNWRELSHSTAYGTVAGTNTVGNTGETRLPFTTTSSASPQSIFSTVVNNGPQAPGTVFTFDITAQSGSTAGTNIGAWLGYQAGWDITGHRFMYVAGTKAGNATGSQPPLGWDISIDGDVASTANIYVQGDSSSTPVHWTLILHHRDPGQ